MGDSRLPEIMSFQGNVSNNWRIWKQKFDLYLLASGKSEKPDNVKIAILLNLLGDEGILIYNTFDYAAGEDREMFETIVNKFTAYCNPMKNLVYEHFKFFKRDQLPGETVDQFITALKQLATSCEFQEKDVLIRDRIVLGIRDPRIQEKLLQTANVELNEAIRICQSLECSVATQKEIHKDSVSVSAINSRFRDMSMKYTGNQPKGFDTNQGSAKCSQCGLSHAKNACSAANRICSRCKQKGHYRKFCSTRLNVHEVGQLDSEDENQDDNTMDEDQSEGGYDYFTWTVTTSSIDAIEWFEKVKISGSDINLKIDTGSQVNILNISDFKLLNGSVDGLTTSHATLSSYSGHKINVKGQKYLNCEFNGVSKNLLFFVLSSEFPSSILGLDAIRALKIISSSGLGLSNAICSTIQSESMLNVKDILTEYGKVFSGIGRVNTECKIMLKDNFEPVICAPRKIPIALKNKVKAKLDKMVAEKIIVPVSEPTDWVHPIVIANKSNGDIRICMDPRALNPYVKRENFKIPTQETLFAELAGAKYFSLMDASSAFLQLPLDHKSSLLCTIATNFGRYRFLRLPYGICCAPEFFQKFMYQTLDGIQEVISYFDDILVFGQTLRDHNHNLKEVLSTISKCGLTLNPGKSSFCQNQLKFLGHIISDKGIAPDEKKIKDIANMKPPEDKKQLQRFLGMIVYLAKFVPNLSPETSTLRKLLSNQADWVWTENETRCFNHLKQSITNAPVLSFFNTNKETTLSVDASPYGLGAVILQENHPIEYASVSLTPTQQRYNHIEKELLAIVYGCERFHYYLFGQKFWIQTDHRPLLGLLKKPLDELSPRIQRLAIRLLRYEFIINYVPGKQMQVADTLSRAPSESKIDTDYLDQNLRVHSIIATTEENNLRLLAAISEDATLEKLKVYTSNGWPSHKSNASSLVKNFWQYRNEIYIHDNIIFYKKRLVIPESLKAEFLTLLHKAHQGVVACKKIAQETVFWPGITSDIEKMVLSCNTCQTYAKSNPREPLTPHEVPQLPWEKIGIDFKSMGNQDFIVIIDYFSKFTIVNKLHNKTAQSVITALKNTFAIQGLAMEIFSDNGPPFNSFEFLEFGRRYGIKLTTSSPYYPRSNGMVERGIQTIKGLLTKAYQDNEDPFLAVLTYNVTPKQGLPAPSELLMGRRLRTTLPVNRQILEPKYSTQGVRKKLQENQIIQKFYHDSNTRKLPDLREDQQVLVQEKCRVWKPGVVLNKSGPNDYAIQVGDAEYRRNRHQLKPLITTAPSKDVCNQETTEDKIEECSFKTSSDPSTVLKKSPIKRSNNPDTVLMENISTTQTEAPDIPRSTTRSGRTIKAPTRLDL